MKHDPKNYEKMSAPHESYEAATVAMESLFGAVGRARQKYRIADVTVIVKMAIINERDEPQGIATYAHFGDSAATLPMCANVLKRERQAMAERLAVMDDIISRANEV